MITKEQIVASEEMLLTAFQNSDLKILENLLHDNAVFVYPNGLSFTKSNVLDNYRSGTSAFNSIVTSEQTINLIDDTAVVSLVMDLTGKYKDQLIQNKFRYIRVWKLCNGRLKVIATSGVQL